jgi:hypothetical protein
VRGESTLAASALFVILQSSSSKASADKSATKHAVKFNRPKKAHSNRCEAHRSALKPLPTALNPLRSALTFPRPLGDENPML